MNTQHTPGPWKNNTAATVRAHDGKILVAQVTWPPGTRIDERRANANLIAAAPTMLAALQKIAANPGDCDMEKGFTSGHIARAAIREALGQNEKSPDAGATE